MMRAMPPTSAVAALFSVLLEVAFHRSPHVGPCDGASSSLSCAKSEFHGAPMRPLGKGSRLAAPDCTVALRMPAMMVRCSRLLAARFQSAPQACTCSWLSCGWTCVALMMHLMPPERTMTSRGQASEDRLHNAPQACACTCESLTCSRITITICSMPPACVIFARLIGLSEEKLQSAQHAAICTEGTVGCSLDADRMHPMPPARTTAAAFSALLDARFPSAKHARPCTSGSCKCSRIASTMRTMPPA
mmetsp:Transcript_138175/g.240387  ORF Transcript_138175/g.240387 Transcript_138175/m.240387 type:complete len:247 (+) Transcript_138175:273-1013(+)